MGRSQLIMKFSKVSLNLTFITPGQQVSLQYFFKIRVISFLCRALAGATEMGEEG